jgi:hypothetical protein
MGSIVECCLFEEENEKIIIEILQTEPVIPLKINSIPLKIKEEEFESDKSDESDESEDDPLDSSEEEFEIVILN